MQRFNLVSPLVSGFSALMLGAAFTFYAAAQETRVVLPGNFRPRLARRG